MRKEEVRGLEIGRGLFPSPQDSQSVTVFSSFLTACLLHSLVC